jgi:hypothetical protein
VPYARGGSQTSEPVAYHDAFVEPMSASFTSVSALRPEAEEVAEIVAADVLAEVEEDLTDGSESGSARNGDER